MATEQEISYTFAYSQDVLYRIKDWLEDNLMLFEEYIEVFDDNDVRTRLQDNTLCSVKKRLLDMCRSVVEVDGNLVLIITRRCIELEVKSNLSDKIKRLCKTRVYRAPGEIEIKFEHIYYEYHTGDSLDPLTATKQMTLYNLLKPNDTIDITTNSHLGSDEILANCRLEFEYEGETIKHTDLVKVAHLINHIECVVVGDVIITPFISHTSLLNDINYRSFVEEKQIVTIINDNENIKLWALKLNGVRGKAYIVNGKTIFIQLDDMQMFRGKNLDTKPTFLHNRIVCFQVEYLEEKKIFYITDVLCVYKYKYDNRNQYNISTCVNVDVFDAISFMNTHKSTILKFNDYTVKFQEFYTHMKHVDRDKELNDGYVGVGSDGRLIKIKPQKSFEMKYVDGKFSCSFGVFEADNVSGCRYGLIYEVIINGDKVVVLKERPDRLTSN
ncbi:late expression factor 4 [Diatraea saccharalis granulovirus]|uniref:Late expression factor 4 n=1 Tax=Diatraea saccharalis granulovirus TaxID=1675862 RepID=A0A0R7EYZ6_9BBAC|nr:late expression factor 4 [Diatraea saccharalis granulovirus]AKN80809.1 late expression factor 4 [Diatraea saccharalis granulovirus]